MDGRPERSLTVRCKYNGKEKKISFSSAQTCLYNNLRHKIELCFSLSNFIIYYKDDNNEANPIQSEEELTSAIDWFAMMEDSSTSSASSIFSLSGSKKIYVHVDIEVDYAGPSLSDSGSIASVDDYQPRSEQSFRLSAGEIDDDAVTVSSSGTRGAPFSTRDRSRRNLPLPPRAPLLSATSASISLNAPSETGGPPLGQHQNPFDDRYQEPAPDRVWERLRQAEEEDSTSTSYDPITSNQIGTDWLREQNERANRSRGFLQMPNSSSDLSEMDDQVGDLSLNLSLSRGPSGRFYYIYEPDSSAVSNSQELVEGSVFNPSIEGGINGKPRPTSRQLNWVAAQQEAVAAHNSLPHTHHSDSSLETLIPPEILQEFPPNPPGDEDLSSCSNCRKLLDYMKYVCYTCGEKPPGSFLQSPSSSKDGDESEPHFTYPPQPHIHHTVYNPVSPTFSSSSRTSVGPSQQKPLSPELLNSNRALFSAPRQKETGYELCPVCIEDAGVTHAIEAVQEPGSSPTVGNIFSSPEAAVIQWRRAAPSQKGQLRHAFLEKIWGHTGWEDVVQSEAETVNCSACSVTTSLHKLYKCASCASHYLCRACYSQVHDLHPRHTFLVLQRKSPHSLSDSDHLTYLMMLNPSEEQSLTAMVHQGVKCAHCLMEIIGARFHCAECEAVDICSNCESAGLPGNIDSADGGHISSHILIKVQSVSRKAATDWAGNPANVNRAGKYKAKSEISSYARTVIGIGSMHTSEPALNEDHGIACSACRKPIIGVRYQCANCPAPDDGYNLCASCEESSYTVHDSYHAFFKLPRPVERPIRSNAPIIPVLYKSPAGPTLPTMYNGRDPTGYLNSLVHPSALCDRCIDRIQGAWFHCAHCPEDPKDLCSSCESVDTHDDNHVFLVFKAPIDMLALRHLMVGRDNSEAMLPILKYSVY
ncbi:hypothetical protein D9757_008077 [Collybiopsis confluens]|uniref:ZZ-type domain-containing protein n=1 Tax=Collybiopsis confluens TaxID=2823264 RepID=A0A8H5H6X5_9AGAR|nr:hypothetical protein D9757_008077 [Collybiopsis confluens]